MAFRLKFSSRALREIGEAQEWYELQSSGLGEEFIAALELQLKRLEQAPLLYAEVIPGVHRALLPRYPYGLFYTVMGNLLIDLATSANEKSGFKIPPTLPFTRKGYAVGYPLLRSDPASGKGRNSLRSKCS